jgi:hypothetical protein
MNCAECEALEAQASIAEEEVTKVKDRIAAALREERGSASPGLLQVLERLERTHQKCLDAIDRHRQWHSEVSNIDRFAEPLLAGVRHQNRLLMRAAQ